MVLTSHSGWEARPIRCVADVCFLISFVSSQNCFVFICRRFYARLSSAGVCCAALLR